MNTRNRIILIIVITVDVCMFSFGLYMKNEGEDSANEALVYKNVKASVLERQYTLLSEITSAEDSLKKCCKR
jgi:hypothetical protein